MAQADKIAEITKLADKSRELCAAAQADIDALMSQVSEKESVIEIEKSKLEAFQQTLEILKPHKASGSSTRSSASTTQRRMRLGAKKRMIYELVALHYSNLKILNECLANTDIDQRYVRDVVRVAINESDMDGDVDLSFSLTGGGRKILNKANKPNDWSEYEPVLDRIIEINETRRRSEAEKAASAASQLLQEPQLGKSAWD